MTGKIVLFFLMTLSLIFQIESNVKAEDEDALRMIIYNNERHNYKIKNDSFFNIPEKLVATDRLFGTGVSPESLLKGNNFTYCPGARYGFIHPSYVGFANGQEKEVQINHPFSLGKLKAKGSLDSSSLTLVGKAKWTSSSWKYELETPKNSTDQIYLRVEVEGQVFLAKIIKCELDISTSFDTKNERIRSTKVRHKWSLEKPAEATNNDKKKQKSLERENILKKWKRDLSHTVTWSYGGKEKVDKVKSKNKGKEVVVSDPRHARAIDLGKKYLWDQIKQESNWGSGKGKGKDSGIYRVGSLALAFFAILRADDDPNDPEVEKYLLKYCNYARTVGYTRENLKTGKPIDRCGYAAGCALMMIEAALNSNDTDGNIVKGADSKKSNRFRGSKKLQEELLELAKVCVQALNAQGKSLANYGKDNDDEESTQRGHLWSYMGTRSFASEGDRTPFHTHRSPAQYAVLGLRCAKLIGLSVVDNVWVDIHKGSIEDFQTIQEGVRIAKTGKKILEISQTSTLQMEFDNGIIKTGYKAKNNGVGLWGYTKKGRSHGYANFNMVCAALGNIAMAYSFMPEAADPKMKDVVAMGLHYCQIVLDDLYENLSYYDYYSWERVAVFYGVKKVKGKNWHHDMSEKICDAQNMATGEFVINFSLDNDHSSLGEFMSTSYAVLFLKKATKKLRYSIN